MIAMLLLAACLNPITNDFVLEDQAFLDALPQSTARTELPAQTELQRGANGFMATVESMLSWIDIVTAQPPNVRESDRRVWGPYPEELADFSWKLEIIRTEPGAYTWTFTRQRGGETVWIPFFRGESLTGYAAAESKGAFVYDASLITPLTGDDDFGQLEADYDFIGARRIDSILTAPSGARSWYTLEQYEDTVDLWFFTQMDLEQNGSGLEDYEQSGRWLLSGAGRSDIEVTGGDLGPIVGVITECWDDMGTVTYRGNIVEGIFEETTGDINRCVFEETITRR
ncbi:MAG: hypothetical protein AAFV53_05305 [Myxococcota bacterium]